MTNTTKRRFFSGSTLEAALVTAASEYGIPVEEIAYREIEKRHGFLRVRRNVVIEVDPESPRRAEGAKAPKIAPVPERRTPPPLGGRGEEDSEASETESSDVQDEVTGEEAPDEPSPAERPRRRRSQPAPQEVDEDADDDDAPGASWSEDEEDDSDESDDGAYDDEDDEDDYEGDDDEEEDLDTEDDVLERDEVPAGRPRRRRAASSEPCRDARAADGGRDEDRRPSASRQKSHDEDEEGAGGRRRSRRRTRARRPAPPRRELQPIEKRLELARGPEADAIVEAMEWLLDLVDVDVDPKVYQGDERYEIELRGTDREVLTADDGKVLTAVEHLLPRVLHGVHGEALPVRVDSENFQEGREERLRETAFRMAEEVRSSGMPEVLEPMDPADRRIVHLALSDEPEVETRSLGSGFFKRVKIVPLEP